MAHFPDDDDQEEQTDTMSTLPLAGARRRVASLTVLSGPQGTMGRVVRIEPDVVIGRSPDVKLRIVATGVSRNHAQVLVSQTGAFVKDLRSKNGTFVNGLRVTEQRLNDGDVIQVGGQVLLKFAYVDVLEEQLHNQLVQNATRDALTGAYNKSVFQEFVTKELNAARRHKLGLTVALVDIDHFKQVNDTWGHLIGDIVLSEVSRALHAVLRSEDVLGRFGGEEFAVLLRQCEVSQALHVLDRARQKVEALRIPFKDKHITVTISAGVATFDPDAHRSQEDLLGAADQALYKAKRGGRNRVEKA
jgi:diguanylate cyclase (GGDEF)-like protein